VSTRDFSWGKGGRCVWLTIYHPCSAKRQENPRPILPGTPWATSACCGMSFNFTIVCFLCGAVHLLQHREVAVNSMSDQKLR